MNIPVPSLTLKERYHAYLHSDHWANLRGQKLALAGNKCQCCEATDSVQVHHIHYRNWYDCSVSDLIALCRRCHKLFHQAMEINGTKSHFYSEDQTVSLIRSFVQRNAGKPATSHDTSAVVERLFQKCRSEGFHYDSLMRLARALRKIAKHRVGKPKRSKN